MFIGGGSVPMKSEVGDILIAIIVVMAIIFLSGARLTGAALAAKGGLGHRLAKLVTCVSPQSLATGRTSHLMAELNRSITCR